MDQVLIEAYAPISCLRIGYGGDQFADRHRSLSSTVTHVMPRIASRPLYVIANVMWTVRPTDILLYYYSNSTPNVVQM